MVDIRIYRAAFVLALLSFVVVMFSLQERPAPLTSTLAPDAFDELGATGLLGDIVAHNPDRRPGSAGDRKLASSVQSRLQGLGFETSRDDFSAQVDGNQTGLTNVIGVLSGQSERQLVVMAPRDADTRPGASTAASTAVMLELANALAAAQHDKTLVFVSLDGGSADAAGARRFASHYPNRSKVDAALVIDDVAASYAKRPFLVPWSTDSRRGSLQLLRTAEAALAHELGAHAGSPSLLGQLVHQAWPLTLREQGPLVSAGMDAITITDHGEVPRSGAADTLEGISRLRLQHFGKAVLSTVLALDSAPSLERSPPSYLVAGRNVIPRWAISLLAIGLLAPALAAALDGFARARRRGRSAGRWIRWALAGSVPFVAVVIAARTAELFDWLPGTPSEALAPATRPSFAAAAPAVAALALVLALAWLVVRPRVAGGATKVERASVAEAAVALTLVLGVEVVVLWLSNPFGALFLIPVVHLCLLTALPEGPNRRLLAVATVGAALLLPGLVLLYYGAHLDLGAHPIRYLLLVITGDGSFWSLLLGSLIAGSLVSTLLVTLARPRPEPSAEISVRGPHSYAGPGSLGGTESAMRR